MSDQAKPFRAKTELTNDQTGKSYEAGDLLGTGDFPLATLEHWVDIGAVQDLRSKEKPDTSKADKPKRKGAK